MCDSSQPYINPEKKLFYKNFLTYRLHNQANLFPVFCFQNSTGQKREGCFFLTQLSASTECQLQVCSLSWDSKRAAGVESEFFMLRRKSFRLYIYKVRFIKSWRIYGNGFYEIPKILPLKSAEANFRTTYLGKLWPQFMGLTGPRQ